MSSRLPLIRGGFVIALVTTFVACGKSSPGHTNYTVTSVVVTPGTAKVEPGATLAFSARVEGPASIPPVQWSIVQVPGEDRGWISSDGLYRAPELAPTSTMDVRIVATAGGVSGFATVTVPSASIVLTGGASSATLGQVLQFEAVVEGTSDPRVEWSTQHGSIDATGRYTAPSMLLWQGELDVVRAQSLGNGLTAEQWIALYAGAPTVSSVSSPAGPGDIVTIHGASFGQVSGLPSILVYFPAAPGNPIPVPGTYVSQDTVTATVPVGTTSGELWVAVEPSWMPSEPVPFERAPRLRLHLARSDVMSGEAVPMEVAVLGVPGPVPITFAADAGTFVGDTFVAPEVGDLTWVVVRACVTDSSICSAATLAVHPLLVRPTPAVVSLGGTLALVAERASGAVPATFSLVSGPWSVSPDGTFTASPAIADTGEAWVVADDGAHAERAPVVVAGGVPGELARVAHEYLDERVVDPSRGLPSGTLAHSIAVSGTRAWVLASDRRWSLFWIDTYDIGDPFHPQWLGATESATSDGSLHVVEDRLYALSEMGSGRRAIACYDISGPLPVLVGRVELAAAPSLSLTRVRAFLEMDAESGAIFVPEVPPIGDPSFTAHIYAVSDPTLSTVRDVTLTFPTEAHLDSWWITVSARGGRAYAAYPATDGSRRLGAWDLSTVPGAWLGSTAGLEGPISFPGPMLLVGGCLFDRGTPVPSRVSCIPAAVGKWVVASEGSRHLITDEFQSYIVDLTDPSAPRIDAGFPSRPGVMAGGLLMMPTAEGIALRDATPGGTVVLASDIYVGDLTSNLNGVAIRGDRVYVTGYYAALGGFLATVDLTQMPPAVEAITPLASPGMTVLLSGDLLLVGSTSSLELRLAADPHAPPVASLPLDVLSIAVDGGVAWVGTWGGALVAVDISTAAAPFEVGRLAMDAYPRRIRILAPGRLAIALPSYDYMSGDLTVVDGSIPSAPTVLATAGLGIPVIDVALYGTTAVLATSAGLVSVDLSVPSAPATRAVVPIPADVPYDPLLPPWYVSAEVRDGIAWLGTYNADSAALGYDVRDPARPREVARWLADGDLVGGTIMQFAFDGQRMVVSKATPLEDLSLQTLVVLDAAQPRNLLRRYVRPAELLPPPR